MGSPLPPLSLSFLCPLPLSLYHMQILVIFFKCCLLLPCIQFLPGALACVPAFSHFSIFHVRFVVVADDTTHIHTRTPAHTRNMLHTTLVCEALCCLHFHYFFYVIFSLLPFFFLCWPTILTACQKEVFPTPLATNSSMPALLLLFPPSVCILNYPWANGLCVCCCAALPCSHFLLCSFYNCPSSPFSSL